jgi:ABC-type multidrug transport system fused ATPase/permease subunit
MFVVFADHWSKIVAASVAPVVVISASGLLCLAFYNRLAAIVSRLRAVQRERLTEMAGYRASIKSGDFFATQRHLRLLTNLAEQTSRIIARAHLIRLTLLGLLGAVCLMIVSSLMNGVALFWPSFAVGAAIAFGGGMLSLLFGVITAMRELREALDVVKLESQLVTDLTDSHEDHQPKTVDETETDDAIAEATIG